MVIEDDVVGLQQALHGVQVSGIPTRAAVDDDDGWEMRVPKSLNMKPVASQFDMFERRIVFNAGRHPDTACEHPDEGAAHRGQEPVPARHSAAALPLTRCSAPR